MVIGKPIFSSTNSMYFLQFSGRSSYFLIPRISHFHPGRVSYTGFAFSSSVVVGKSVVTIPYVAAMLPVVQSIAALMNDGRGMEPYVFYFGLLIGATLGGNLTPIGASANIAAIGLLRKNGETVTTRDFLRIGVPFTLAAVLTGYMYLWLVWGRV